MEEIRKNKIFWGLIFLTVFNFLLFLFSKVIIEKAAERAIQKLQKEYSPSPYGPGIDPDKINIDGVKVINTEINNFKQLDSSISNHFNESEKWREEWEKSRNF